MTEVIKTETIASTPKDEQWYQIPSNNSEHFIKWNVDKSMWQSMVITENGPASEQDWLPDGTEIVEFNV